MTHVYPNLSYWLLYLFRYYERENIGVLPMKITETSLNRNKYKKEVDESEMHNQWYEYTWTKIVEDEKGRKFTIVITENSVGKLEQFGFPKYTSKAFYYRNDYRESFTVSYSANLVKPH